MLKPHSIVAVAIGEEDNARVQTQLYGKVLGYGFTFADETSEPVPTYIIALNNGSTMTASPEQVSAI